MPGADIQKLSEAIEQASASFNRLVLLAGQGGTANHHGDLCFHDGKLYVAVNLGKFNDPEGNADSWVYVYDAESLKELARHETQEVLHGAGGIGYPASQYQIGYNTSPQISVRFSTSLSKGMS